MREILFRGKRVDNGEWVYGTVEFHLIDGDRTKSKKYAFITFDTMDETGKVYRCNFEVIPETVGQCTGMTDRNGNKIFEGDIVKNTTGKLEKVVFVNGCFQCASIECPNANLYLLDTYTSFIEAVGNIHDGI